MLRKLKWPLIILALGCVAVPFLGGRCLYRQQTPISITFIGFTNVYYADRPLAVFLATNIYCRPLRYATHIERKTEAGWPVYYGPLPHHEKERHDVPAGQTFKLLEYPRRDSAPWRVSVVYSLVETSWDDQRWRVAEYFYDRNLPRLGQIFHKGAQGYYVIGPEMKKQHLVEDERAPH